VPPPLHFRPVDLLGRIDPGRHVGAEIQQAEHFLRLEADVSVDEQQMGRGRIAQEVCHHILPRPGDQRVAALHQHGEAHAALVAGALQLQERGGEVAGDLAAIARRADGQMDGVAHAAFSSE